MVDANICVFHLWDPNNEKFDLVIQKDLIDEITKKFPEVRLSIENIPTKLRNYSPFELVKDFRWITLDLRWATLYDELDRFSKLKDKIVNIHVRGTLELGEFKLKNAPFTLYEALDLITNKWKYKGLFTIEPEGGLSGTSWEDLIKAIGSIKEIINKKNMK